MMQVSAAVKLIPKPPALVESRNTLGWIVSERNRGPAKKCHLVLRILVECVDVLLTIHELHATVQPAELDLLKVEVVTQDVQHLCHLGKNE